MLEGVRRLHDAPSLDALRAEMMTLVDALVANEHIAYNDIDVELDQVFTRFSAQEQDEDYTQYARTFERLMHQHPILQYCIDNPNPTAQRLSDFVSQPALRDLGLYQEVYSKVDTQYQTIIDLGEPGRTISALAVNRKSSDFQDGDLTLLRLLQPHLRQALANCRQRFLVDSFLAGVPSELLFDRVMTLGLSEREAEVCFWIAQGKSNQEIGELLRISPLTVKKHGENIYRKLGAGGRVEVVRQVLRALTDSAVN